MAATRFDAEARQGQRRLQLGQRLPVLPAQRVEEIAPLTHGSGFAVTPTKFVTNAHVIREALLDDGFGATTTTEEVETRRPRPSRRHGLP